MKTVGDLAMRLVHYCMHQLFCAGSGAIEKLSFTGLVILADVCMLRIASTLLQNSFQKTANFSKARERRRFLEKFSQVNSINDEHSLELLHTINTVQAQCINL